MKTIILSIFLLTSFLSFAQDRTAQAIAEEATAIVMSNEYEYNLWNLRTGDTSRIFADNAYIRDYPGIHGHLIDSLQVGQDVFIQGLGYNPTVIRGFDAPWCGIYYYKNGQKHQGYIWMGLLALNSTKAQEGEIFVHGFSRYVSSSNDEQASYYIAEVKLVDSRGQFIAKTSYHVPTMDQSYQYAKILNGMGLENVQYIHRFTFSGEACGIPTNYYYVAWTGKEFIRLPDRSSVSDAGIYYYDEQILFPSEHKGDKNLILKKISQGEVVDEDAQELEYNEKNWEERFLWDGSKYTQLIHMATR